MKRGLIGLTVANAISMIGSRMSLVALPWFVLATTGSAAKTGIVAAVEMLPYVLACGAGAPVLDRVGLRRASIIADVSSGAVVAAIPLLHFSSGLSFPVLAALIAVAGALRGFGDTAKRVLYRHAVFESGVNSARAMSVVDGISRLATLIGAPVAGVLIAGTDAATVLMIDAATFVICAAIVLLAVRPSRPVATVQEGYFQSLRSGLAYMRQDRLVAAVLLLAFGTNIIDAAYSSVLLPLWATEIAKSPVAFGVICAALAGGAVLGNVIFTVVAPYAPRLAMYAGGTLVGGSPRFFAMAFSDDVWTVYIVSFVAGLAIAAINPIIGAVSFERVPAEMQSRIQGLGIAVAWIGIPFGSLLGGWAGEGNVSVALAGFGACYLALSLWPLFGKVWRQINTTVSLPRVPSQSGETRLSQPASR